MKIRKKIHLECKHENENVNTTISVSNHHSLTKRDIYNLLRRAQQTGDYYVRNSIQIRLCQGIRGYVCPRVITGSVSQKEYEVSKLYLGSNYMVPTRTLVNKLYKIMNF